MLCEIVWSCVLWGLYGSALGSLSFVLFSMPAHQSEWRSPTLVRWPQRHRCVDAVEDGCEKLREPCGGCVVVGGGLAAHVEFGKAVQRTEKN